MKAERAFKLAIDAMEAGWSVLVKPGRDTGNHEFVTVEGAYGQDAYFLATWHTRETGTYRIFGTPLLGRSRAAAWPSSLAAIRAQLERSTA